MRAKEFIRESREGSIEDDVAEAIPSAYVIPALPNQDPYKQYRFGMALAAARANKATDDVNPRKTDFQGKSPWGENAIVVSYTGTTQDIIDDALAEVGLGSGAKKQITSKGSHETKDVTTNSPVAKPKKNKYGV